MIALAWVWAVFITIWVVLDVIQVVQRRRRINRMLEAASRDEHLFRPVLYVVQGGNDTETGFDEEDLH